MGDTLFFEDIALEEETQRRVAVTLAMNAQLILMAGVSISGMALSEQATSIQEAEIQRDAALHAQNVRADVWTHFLEKPNNLFPGVLLGKERSFVSEPMDDLIVGKTDPTALMAFGIEMLPKLPWVLQLLNRYTAFLEATNDFLTLERTVTLVQNIVDFLCGDRGVESLILGERWEDFRLRLREERVTEKEADRFKALSRQRTELLEQAMMSSQSRPYPGSDSREMDATGVLKCSK